MSIAQKRNQSPLRQRVNAIKDFRCKNLITVLENPNDSKNQDGDYTQKRLAVWFGNESRGISDIAVKRSEACIQIEMGGMIESLNLATATGIVLYEITKQRRAYQKINKRGRRIDPPVVA